MEVSGLHVFKGSLSIIFLLLVPHLGLKKVIPLRFDVIFFCGNESVRAGLNHIIL